ncbi:MAG TPA: DUF1080 domain-containing protein [Phnomibacter sp.]|nr:DUF1080 domain-containing protein [Phnomibacter sp.]
MQFQKSILAAATAGVLLLAGCAGKTQQTATGKTDKGFKALFDGKTTAGWHCFNKTTVGAGWKIEDGALYLDPAAKDGGDIVSNLAYENFHLKLEWKISKNGNSGIIFFVQESPKYDYTFRTGPEMQVIDNDGHSDGKIVKHRAGDLYDLIACKRETVKPVGEWNLAEIISDHGKLELRLNGETVVSTVVGDNAWKEMVANSKFKTMPDFGLLAKGKIALQDHGNMVWYRNIQIKQL